MEHRHFPRQAIDMMVQLFTLQGKTYPARLLELSAIGMRIVVNEALPAQIRLVDVLLPCLDQDEDSPYRLRMFVARRDQSVLGLCLVNEKTRIDIERYRHAEAVFFNIGKLANY